VDISTTILSCADLVKNIRRDLHKIPEASCFEIKTQNYICEFLDRLNLSYTKIETGVVVDIKGSNPTKTIGLRADIDALAIAEKNDCSYKSSHNGFMHACGHDGHTAMLLAAIDIFTKNPPKQNVRAIFQFGEEGAGGAEIMIKQGALDGVDEIYAIHLDPSLDVGVFATREGAMMAGTEELEINFYGKSAHCAEPYNGINALKPLADLIAGSDKIAPKNSLFHVGKIVGGTACNAIASHAKANATIRYFDTKDKISAYENLNLCLKAANKKHGTTVDIKKTASYPPVVNTKLAIQTVKKLLPNLIEKQQTFTAEDFAFYTQKIDGALVWLGTKTDKHFAPLHADTFDFDESVLLYGVQFFYELVS